MSHLDSKWIFPLKYLGKSYGGICLLLFILDIKIYTITCFQYKNEGKNFLKPKNEGGRSSLKSASSIWDILYDPYPTFRCPIICQILAKLNF